MTPSAESYRQVMRRLPTGVSVLTMRWGESIHGMTANTVTSVSLDPILILTAIDRTARAHDLLVASREFVVNVLGAGQDEISRRFAVRDMPDDQRWEGVETAPARALEAPRLAGCTGYLECRVRDSHEGGDHTIFVAEVVDLELGAEAPPLVFWQRGYWTVT